VKCRVCDNALFPGRAVFRCQCGAHTHGYCWERHVLDCHQPPFAVGTITLNGEFEPKQPGAKAGRGSAAKELATAERE